MSVRERRRLPFFGNSLTVGRLSPIPFRSMPRLGPPPRPDLPNAFQDACFPFQYQRSVRAVLVVACVRVMRVERRGASAQFATLNTSARVVAAAARSSHRSMTLISCSATIR